LLEDLMTVLARVGLILCTLLMAAATATAAPDNPAAIARAQAHVRQNAAQSFFDADQALVAKDAIVDADGTEHVRFGRTYRGLRVIGGDLVVHGDANGAFLGLSQSLEGRLTLGTRPALASPGAVRRAIAEFAGRPSASRAELVVYAREAATLAYEVIVDGELDDQTPSELHVIVDATTAAILDSWDGVETASGTGSGFFNGQVTLETTPIAGGFSLKDPTRGNQYTVDMKNKQGGNGTLFTDANNVWGDFTLSNRQTVGVDAQYGTAMTWDYYKNIHGRLGIANDGKGAYNRVHFGRNYNNAFWQDSCFCMTYGDGDGRTFNPFDSLDVAGHEMSHGVTSRTSNLIYSGESGGLNEGNSDIFGTMVEYFANNANDAPDYLIGERLYKSGNNALRVMYRPSLDGASADCWYGGVGSINVHYSSGVANHFFYLLAEGTAPAGGPASPTCAAGDGRVATGNGALTGIGRTDAQKIWYRALTVYFTSSTNYAGARTATMNAAVDLFGAGSAQQNAVAAAWSAVKVN
jgi:Zn-dependent metalloprotease